MQSTLKLLALLTNTLRSDDASIDIRLVRGDGHARLLCARSAQPMVHPGIRRLLRARLGLRLSAGSLAVRHCRSGLVFGGAKALGASEFEMSLHEN